MKNITLKDIAQHCDLAATTVSRILNGKSTYCSREKIALVKSIAKEWNYRPNIGYRIMTGRSTNIAAVLFSQPRITQDDQINRLYMQLNAELHVCGFTLYTTVLDGDQQFQMKRLEELEERGCRYYIFIGSPAYCEEIHMFLKERGRNCIGFNNNFIPHGIWQDQGGAYLQYLKMAVTEKRENFKFAVTDRFFEQRILPGIPPDLAGRAKDLLLPVAPIGFITDNSYDHYFNLGYRVMKEELRRNPEIQAMAFPSDYHVFGAAAALREVKFHAGGVHLFGMGDAVASRFAGVRFTTSRFNMEECGKFLVQHLMDSSELQKLLPAEIVDYDLNRE